MQPASKIQAGEKFQPTPEEVEYGSAINTCSLLEMACEDGFSADYLFRALVEIEQRFHDAKRTPFSEEMSARILEAVVRVQEAAIEHLPDYQDQDWSYITGNFDALAALIIFCSEPSCKTASRSRGYVDDVRDHAKIFQNHIHNLALSEDICARVVASCTRRDAQATDQRPANVSKAA